MTAAALADLDTGTIGSSDWSRAFSPHWNAQTLKGSKTKSALAGNREYKNAAFGITLFSLPLLLAC